MDLLCEDFSKNINDIVIRVSVYIFATSLIR